MAPKSAYKASDSFKALLIDSVRDFPWLWDKSHVDFRDAMKKANSWKTIVEKMRASEAGCADVSGTSTLSSICQRILSNRIQKQALSGTCLSYFQNYQFLPLSLTGFKQN